MPFVVIKKQYLAFGMLVFVALFFFNSRPAFQCQFTPEVVPYLPTIYGITPTYTRLAQKADLTRLSQTLLLVKNFHWIIIEDSDTKTKLVANLLKESTLKYTHLNVKTHKSKQSTASGVEQRNLALNWLREHLLNIEDRRGVVYFMDDDNTYALKVFEEMRKIHKVGVWPVGIVGGMRVEMPLVTDGKVTGYNAVWKPFRPFPIDMAGFAINATLFIDHPEAKFSRKVQSGYQESEILKYFTTKEELEPLAENCTKVYVWHTRTQKPSILNPKKLKHPPIPDDHIEPDAFILVLRAFNVIVMMRILAIVLVINFGKTKSKQADDPPDGKWLSSPMNISNTKGITDALPAKKELALKPLGGTRRVVGRLLMLKGPPL